MEHIFLATDRVWALFHACSGKVHIVSSACSSMGSAHTGMVAARLLIKNRSGTGSAYPGTGRHLVLCLDQNGHCPYRNGQCPYRNRQCYALINNHSGTGSAHPRTGRRYSGTGSAHSRTVIGDVMPVLDWVLPICCYH